jgi:hypothetical protein
MIFQIVAPFTSTMYGDSFKDAIKDFVKLNRHMNITNMIIRDQAKHYQANIRYYQEDTRNKVGIDVYPTTFPFMPPIVVNGSMNNTMPFAPLSPLSPLGPLSPISPVVPTVIHIPNN